ncbi:hypothetical protein PR048_025518 [Dryococelus australis]|uniref:Uncharacterized protein n=1 Tax=Dryococelus australis TaxID=614101 RepID=A0ABQ9GRI4_9NEOP|nr:hypothetical protein PR048_025518 [Dryococelus australis]
MQKLNKLGMPISVTLSSDSNVQVIESTEVPKNMNRVPESSNLAQPKQSPVPTLAHVLKARKELQSITKQVAVKKEDYIAAPQMPTTVNKPVSMSHSENTHNETPAQYVVITVEDDDIAVPQVLNTVPVTGSETPTPPCLHELKNVTPLVKAKGKAKEDKRRKEKRPPAAAKDEARKEEEKTAERNKKYTKQSRLKSLKIGQLAVVNSTDVRKFWKYIRAKLLQLYSGPCRITGKKRGNCYELPCPNTDESKSSALVYKTTQYVTLDGWLAASSTHSRDSRENQSHTASFLIHSILFLIHNIPASAHGRQPHRNADLCEGGRERVRQCYVNGSERDGNTASCNSVTVPIWEPFNLCGWKRTQRKNS